MVNNIFLEKLYEKHKCQNIFSRFIHRLKFKWFIYKLNTTAPDFNLLWQIAVFLKVLSVIYIYRNNKSDRLYIMDNKNKEENKCEFVLNIGDVGAYNGKIIFKLTDISINDKFIEIEIRDVSNTIINSNSFKDGEAIITNEHDEQMFININNWLMDSVVELLKQYYYKK